MDEFWETFEKSGSANFHGHLSPSRGLGCIVKCWCPGWEESLMIFVVLWRRRLLYRSSSVDNLVPRMNWTVLMILWKATVSAAMQLENHGDMPCVWGCSQCSSDKKRHKQFLEHFRFFNVLREDICCRAFFKNAMVFLVHIRSDEMCVPKKWKEATLYSMSPLIYNSAGFFLCFLKLTINSFVLEMFRAGLLVEHHSVSLKTFHL